MCVYVLYFIFAQQFFLPLKIDKMVFLDFQTCTPIQSQRRQFFICLAWKTIGLAFYVQSDNRKQHEINRFEKQLHGKPIISFCHADK